MKTLVIGKVWPEPSSSAAGVRLVQLMETLLSLGHELHFCSPAAPGPYAHDLSGLAVSARQVPINDPAFDELVCSLQPDIVVFDRFTTEEQFGWRVAERCPNALRLLDTEDLHFLRQAREERLKGRVASGLLRSRELASIFRSDLSLIISQAEMSLLRSIGVPQALLLYLPYLYPALEGQDKLPGFEGRQGFVFTGNFLHAPNTDGLQWLCTAIWPAIRKNLPEAQLHVYGAYAGNKVLALHAPKHGIIVHGRADEIAPVLRRHRVSLASLRFGAGLKGKVVESMRAGLPVIATTVAAEGLEPGGFPWCGSICDDPVHFAAEAVSLYTNSVLWNTCSHAGFGIHNRMFDRREHRETLRNSLAKISEDLPGHRHANAIGQMLDLQSFQATKYMSLYIEMKNRLAAQSELLKKV